MLIGASEGQGWRYEVMDAEDGFLVRVRDVDTGEVEDAESRLFVTAAVAFAYADVAAAFDRYASARVTGDETAEALLAELHARQALYEDVSRRLGDGGIAAGVLSAWDEAAAQRDRRRLH